MSKKNKPATLNLHTERSRSAQPEAGNPSEDDSQLLELEQRLAELRSRISQQQQKALQQIADEINDMARDRKVGLGVILNLPKLFDIIAYMVRYGKPEIKIQFQVWPDDTTADESSSART